MGNAWGMSWETADVLSADTTVVLSADATDVLSADTTDVLSTDAQKLGVPEWCLRMEFQDLGYQHCVCLRIWEVWGPRMGSS